MTIQNKRLGGILLAAVTIRLVPLVAMQFTNEVNWTPSDFTVAGILLLGTGLLCELVIRKVTQTKHRLIRCGVLLTTLLLVWIELAVGLFGTPFAGN